MRIGSQDGTDWRLQMQAMQAARSLQRTEGSSAQTSDRTNAEALQAMGTQGSDWGAWQRLSSDDASLVRMMDANGQGRRMTLLSQGTDDTDLASRVAEMEARMEQMRTDMQALADTDIASLSDDEVKSTLTTLISDRIATAPPRGGRAGAAYGTDVATDSTGTTAVTGTSMSGTVSSAAEKAAALVDGMDATEMRALLEKIQEHAVASASRQSDETGDTLTEGLGFMQGMPPPPPPPDGMGMFGDAAGDDASYGGVSGTQLGYASYGGVSGTQLGYAALSSDASSLSDTVGAIMEQLMTVWQNNTADTGTTDATATSGTSGTSGTTTGEDDAGTISVQDYVSQLKASLTDLFISQRERLDSFSNLLFTQLDLWSAGQAADTATEQEAADTIASATDATSGTTL